MTNVRWCCCEDERKAEDIHGTDLKQIQSHNILKLACDGDFEFEDTENSFEMIEKYSDFVKKLLRLAEIDNETTLAQLKALEPKAKNLLFAIYKGARSDPLSRVLLCFSDDSDATTGGYPDTSQEEADFSDATGPTFGDEGEWILLLPEEQCKLTPSTTVGSLLHQRNAKLLWLNRDIVSESDSDRLLGKLPLGSIYYQLK